MKMAPANALRSAFNSFEMLPRCRLAPLPTPLIAARQLGGAIGVPELWLKRDDLIAFGFGGNKIRGLEFLIADALARGADIVLTGAGTQSNHVRATAAAAAWAKLDMLAVYWGTEPARIDGNFALTRLLGARTHFTGDFDRASVDGALETIAAELRVAGRRPYVIPRGGACALGVVGHIAAVAELAAQCREAGIEPATIALAVGSGGTFAGWLVGIRAHALPWRLAGFTVSRPSAEVRPRIVALANEAAQRIGATARVGLDDVVLNDDFLGQGYGISSSQGDVAIALAARLDGVFFDPTYTGKAFAGVMAQAGSGRLPAQDTIVFLHTGGQPTLLASLSVDR